MDFLETATYLTLYVDMLNVQMYSEGVLLRIIWMN